MRTRLDEIVGPHVVAPLRSEPDAGTIPVTQPDLVRPAGRYLQPAQPDPLDPLAVDQPAGRLQQRADLPVAVAPVPARQLHEIGGQRRLIVSAPRHLALRRTMLTERTARAALGDVQVWIGVQGEPTLAPHLHI